MLEQDLDLGAKELDAHKALIAKLVDQVRTAAMSSYAVAAS